jgi:hypothetical protein
VVKIFRRGQKIGLVPRISNQQKNSEQWKGATDVRAKQQHQFSFSNPRLYEKIEQNIEVSWRSATFGVQIIVPKFSGYEAWHCDDITSGHCWGWQVVVNNANFLENWVLFHWTKRISRNSATKNNLEQAERLTQALLHGEILVSPQVWSSFRIAIANWQIILRNTYCYGYSVSHVYFAVRSVYVGKTGFYVGKMN